MTYVQPETKAMHFLSLNREGWQILIRQWEQPSYRATQIADWIFKHDVYHPSQMSNLPATLRERMEKEFSWTLPEIADRQESEDGATKLLFKSEKGQMIESVIMRYENRNSLCVSSQVGCKLSCSFCQTGKLGFVRHLEKHEILAQFVVGRQILKSEEKRLSHVVFMGMGEPFDNYANSVGAANAMISPEEWGLSARHVTLSTSGMVPRIIDLIDDSRAMLAVSLHAAREDLRTELMPINKRYPLTELKKALLRYQDETGRPITLEYILIKNKNCTQRDAKELIRFIHGLRAKVNLIPFNPHPGLEYEKPDAQDIRRFQEYLSDRSVPAPVRYSKGLDVSAACGQLAAKRMGQSGGRPQRNSLRANH